MRAPSLAAVLCLAPAALAAQVPADLAAERADFAGWLAAAPNSPYAAIYHQPLAGTLVLGADAEPGLLGVPRGVIVEGPVQVRLRTDDGERVLPRNRDVAHGAFRIRVGGERGRTVVTVFGTPRAAPPPSWYDYDPAAVVEGALAPPDRPDTRRMLGFDGIEVEGRLAGTFAATLAGRPVRLAVYRMPEPGTEDAELMVFFRDGTSGETTYPAGRFLALRPLGGGRYRADFNRARNPFCAYNGVFPCPLPWSGNVVEGRIEAGERYRAHADRP